jgi:hypothetical protein
MSIAALITEGIGPGGSVLYVMTGGLSIGAFVDVWTNDSPAATTWSSDTASSGVWTDISGPSTSWTNS